MKRPLRGLIIILLGSGFIIASLAQAYAGFYRKRFRRQNAHGYVVAESLYGRGTVRGRVRPTRRGPQVQLPGGTWIYCAINCTHTLRINSLDLWENMGRESDGIGIFGYQRSWDR